MVAKDQSKYYVVLDEDSAIGESIQTITGQRIQRFAAAEQLLPLLPNLTPAAVFLEVRLAGVQSGLEILPELRAHCPFAPLIVLTANADPAVISIALGQGADDFIRKPLSPQELQARLRLRLEEAASRQAREEESYGDITVQARLRVITGPLGKRFAAPIETQLLSCLIQSQGNVIDKASLKYRCWGDTKVSDNALHRKLHAVRQILKDVSACVSVETTYGVGISLAYAQADLAAAS